jgi:Rha family phage regulatory protein
MERRADATGGMTGKPDPAKQPIVHKLRGGGVIAWTTEIDAFIGRNRHDNVLAACRKVRDEFKDTDPDFFATHFIKGEYTAKNGQQYLQWEVYRAGFVAMMKHIHNAADKTALYLSAYDRKAEVAEKRKAEPEPEPADPVDEPDLPPAGEPLVHVDGMRVYATTLDIAAFFRKRHKDVLTVVREVAILQPDFAGPNFRPCSYQGDNGKELPAFEVTKAGFTVVVGRFTDAEALAFQIRYVQRFEEMEATLKAQPAGPRTYGSIDDLRADPDALLSLALGYAGQVKTLSGENERLEVQLSVVEPKAAALDALANLKGTLKLRDAAKALGFGPTFFNDRLLQLDVLHRSDGRLVAYQKYVDQGWFIHKPVRLRHRDGSEYIVSQPRVTGHGIAKLAVRLGVGVQAVLGQGVLNLMNRDEGDGEALH